jgi:hypothetical protein
MTAAQCMALLSHYRSIADCRCCDHLDWALAELQQVADAALACEAAERRVPTEQLVDRASCRPCPVLDAVFAWLEPDPPIPDGGTAAKSSAR